MKNVLITGAAGNLGHAVVEKFVKEGYKILATVDPKADNHLKAGVQAYPVDLMNESQVNETIAKAIADNKTIDAALLLVGGYAGGNIYETDGTALRKMMSLNFETAYF